jgi:hypothetical protein
MCFSAPKMPEIPKPTPPPTQQSPEVVLARTNERRRAALAAGRQSTILTGPSGVPAAGGAKTLLGQ